MNYLLQMWLVWSLLCCLVFHTAWWGSKNARTPNADLDRQYPWFRFTGEDQWNYWTMLLQSVTLFPFKFALFLWALTLTGSVHFCLGDVKEDSWVKRKISCYAIWLSMELIFVAMTTTVKKEEVDFDYEKWLGPDWKNELAEFKRAKRAATYIPNHTGIIDIPAMIIATRGSAAFVSGAHLKKVPPINRSILAGDGIYVERGANTQETMKKVDEISKR